MSDSIAEEKLRLRANVEKGTKCKCCGQNVKLYKRKINYQQARLLIKLVKLYQQNPHFYHIKDVMFKDNPDISEFAKLEKWSLIEEEVNTNTKKRTSGKWKPTEKGILFAHNKLTVPKYCYIFDNYIFRFSDKNVSILDALGEYFDYQELMDASYE